jgi:hypothetical protein
MRIPGGISVSELFRFRAAPVKVRTTRLVAALVALGVTVGLSACTPDGGEPGTKDGTGSASTAEVLRSVDDVPVDPAEVLNRFDPVRSFLYDGADWMDVEYAAQAGETTALADCMRERGWAFQTELPDRTVLSATFSEDAFGSPLADDARRAAFGYGITSAFTSDADEPTPNSRLVESLAPEDADRFFTDNNTCASAAGSTTQKSPEAWEEYSLGERREAKPERDAYKAGLVAYSSCLENAGFAADIQTESERIQAEARVAFDKGAAGTSTLEALLSEEVALAEQDWSCHREHVLVPMLNLRLVEGQYFLEDHVEALSKVRDDLKRAAGR